MDSRTGEHLATFTWRPRSGLYTLTTESALVAESGQVAASVEVASSCSCRLLTHQTLLWHHHLGHPSLPRLRGMHSRLLVSGLPRSLPPLSRSFAPPCLPCVKGRQRPAPHSSSFPPTTAPLQTLHRDDLPDLRLHSDRGGEFCSRLLEDFRECRIGLVMEVACTSMIHTASPHFLWPFAVRYAAEQLNLWPRVSHPETSPTLWWTSEVGDASAFLVWGSLSLVSRFACRQALSTHSSLRVPWLSHRCTALTVLSPGLSGAGSGVAECTLGTRGPGGTGAGGSATRRQEALSPERLREWAVQWGSPGGGASHLRVRGAGNAGAGGAGDTGVASAGGTGARRQETLSPEQLREWAVQWGSPGGGGTGGAAAVVTVAGSSGGGAGRAGAAGSRGASPGGASAGVPGTGGTSAAGGAGVAGFGGTSPGGAGAGVLGTGGTGTTGGAGTAGGAGGAGTGGTTGSTAGGTGVSGASQQE
ncbi:unnamed protein product [Closterium sp. NIES-53]